MIDTPSVNNEEDFWVLLNVSLSIDVPQTKLPFIDDFVSHAAVNIHKAEVV